MHLISILSLHDCLSSTALVVNFLLNSMTEEESCQLKIICCLCLFDDIYVDI